MSATLAPLPGFRETHPSLTSFYAANPRRWTSREIDLGLRWRGPERASAEWGSATTFRGWGLVCEEEGSFDWLVSRANQHAARAAEARA
jgi:hypothetical protein